jgi:hypothetical protein
MAWACSRLRPEDGSTTKRLSSELSSGNVVKPRFRDLGRSANWFWAYRRVTVGSHKLKPHLPANSASLPGTPANPQR